eukprot:3349432-Pleurochrysis_carterae.AAC.1
MGAACEWVAASLRQQRWRSISHVALDLARRGRARAPLKACERGERTLHPGRLNSNETSRETPK